MDLKKRRRKEALDTANAIAQALGETLKRITGHRLFFDASAPTRAERHAVHLLEREGVLRPGKPVKAKDVSTGRRGEERWRYWTISHERLSRFLK